MKNEHENSSPEIVISVKNLTKIYKLYDSPFDRLKESLNPARKKYHKDYYALNDVSFNVNRGETVGIIGKNGSGKSTLLKVISGVLTPSSGDVYVNGKVSALLELGAGFNQELTGIENIYFNGTLMGYSKEEMDSKLDNILSFADIGEFVCQPVKSYSSGMFVRLAFAVAINVEPEILIIDEALSVGDIKFQRKCFAKIEQFRQNNKTILFVSHGLGTVNMLCDTALILDEGKLLEQGEANKVTRIFQKMVFGEEKFNDSLDDNLSGNDVEEIVGSKLFKTNNANVKTRFSVDNDLRELVEDKLKNWNGQKKAEIIDFGVLNSAGDKVTVLNAGGRYTLYSRVLTYIDFETIHFGYPILNTKGILVFAVNSELQNVEIKPQKRGSIIEGRVDVTMWLAPGDYFLTFRSGASLEVFDVLYDQVHFVVIGDCKIHPNSIVNLESTVSVKSICLS